VKDMSDMFAAVDTLRTDQEPLLVAVAGKVLTEPAVEQW
jgi:hypothetical protein